jgi:hypothetical protein
MMKKAPPVYSTLRRGLLNEIQGTWKERIRNRK